MIPLHGLLGTLTNVAPNGSPSTCILNSEARYRHLLPAVNRIFAPSKVAFRLASWGAATIDIGGAAFIDSDEHSPLSRVIAETYDCKSGIRFIGVPVITGAAGVSYTEHNVTLIADLMTPALFAHELGHQTGIDHDTGGVMELDQGGFRGVLSASQAATVNRFVAKKLDLGAARR
jgi:hypothetical protein